MPLSTTSRRACFPTATAHQRTRPRHTRSSRAFDAGDFVVWNGASDKTIFGLAETNFAFRAWHDWCHWRGQYPFTIVGEINACTMMQSHVALLAGNSPRAQYWSQLLEAEIIGHSIYHFVNGCFPDDQYEFSIGYLAGKYRQNVFDLAAIA